MNQLFQYTYRVPGLVIQPALTTFFWLWCGPLLSQSDCPFRTGLWYGNRGIFDSGNVRNTSLPKTSFPPRTRDGPAQATCALEAHGFHGRLEQTCHEVVQSDKFTGGPHLVSVFQNNINHIRLAEKKKLYITPFLVVNPSSDASIKNGLLLSLKHCTSYFIQDPFLNRYENHY